MIFKQYYLGCLAHASYLIGDKKTKTAVIVDPQRDIEQYIDDARKYQLDIKHVFLTHFHADFVAGHLELRDRVQATIHLGDKAQAEYSFIPEKDGDKLEMGDVRLEFLETPGHTPEGISILVFDLQENPKKPKMVLTGDTLFIGDVGRPDLMASEGISENELAGMLYDSLREKLIILPEDTLVYPAHGAGSLCGKQLSEETVSTIGQQLLTNYALQQMNREDFISLVTENLPQAPQYFSYDARLNKKEHPSLNQSLNISFKPLTLDEVLEKQKQGFQILDTRPELDFSAAHLKGAIQIGLGGKFATWAGIVLSPDNPIIIISEPGAEYESEMRLGRIGFDNIAGYIKGGMEALNERPDLLESVNSWTARDLLEHMTNDSPQNILDVRTPSEFKEFHIKEAKNIPLNDLGKQGTQFSKDKRLIVHCKGGYRSSTACSILQKNGYSNIINLLGGIEGLEKMGSPAREFLVPVDSRG